MPDAQLIEEIVATDPEGLREQALRRVKKRRDLHTHVFSYLTVNLVVWGIWVIVSSSSHNWVPWPLWLTLGWGIGLAFNIWDVYFRHLITEDEIEEEMNRLRSPH